MLRRLPRAPLFPYTTLFRSLRAIAGEYDWGERHLDLQKLPVFIENQPKGSYKVHLDPGGIGSDAALLRSEEHTSELQSLRHLVCRLLLEKKKRQQKNDSIIQ